MKMSKGKNVRISDDTYENLRTNLPVVYKLSKFVEIAILDKLDTIKKKEKKTYDKFPT
jgi:hypothetical protein